MTGLVKKKHDDINQINPSPVPRMYKIVLNRKRNHTLKDKTSNQHMSMSRRCYANQSKSE